MYDIVRPTMTVEQKPERIPPSDPTPEAQAEKAINALVWNLVDLVFTPQALSHPRQSLDDPDGAVTELVTDWKQTLFQEIVATIDFNRDATVPILASVETADPPFNLEDLAYMRRMAKLHQSFQIASVCRQDLSHILTDDELDQFTDGDMEFITEKMSDAFQDTGVYWESLELHARAILKAITEDNQARSDG